MLPNNFKCREILLTCLITVWNAVFVIRELLYVTASDILQSEKTQVSTLSRRSLLISSILTDGSDKKHLGT